MKSGKCWGETRSLFTNENCEVHRIGILEKGYCSKHAHRHKHNIFYVEAGHLKVKVWKNDYDLVDETILGPGDIMDVAPGEYHQFEALKNTIAFEIYYSEPISGDIVRESVGGKIE